MMTETVTPKNSGGKTKIGEIERLKRVMTELNVQPVDIYNVSGVSQRTIKNIIWNNTEIGGKLLRVLHLNYGVSIDWLLTGSGHMLKNNNQVAEPDIHYSTKNPRTQRIINFVEDWMTYANEDEQAWLETQLKFNLSQYRQYIKDKKQD